MRRIVILGCAGSGKSTLARRLGRQLQLPVVHLDRLFWRPGWTWPEIPGFRTRVAEAIAGEAWISDGNYVLTSFDLTVPRADTIIILERPRWLCLFRVLWRSLSHRERPDLPQGCQEKLDWQLISYVWRFRKLGGPRIEAGLLVHGAGLPVIRLRSERAISDFLASQPQSPPSRAG
jgi:adenylate kinase family enzyme